MQANLEKIRGAALEEDYDVTGESWAVLKKLRQDAWFVLVPSKMGVQRHHQGIVRALGRETCLDAA